MTPSGAESPSTMASEGDSKGKGHIVIVITHNRKNWSVHENSGSLLTSFRSCIKYNNYDIHYVKNMLNIITMTFIMLKLLSSKNAFKMGQPLWKTVWQLLYRLNIELSCAPAIPPPGISSRQLKT